MSRSSLSNLVFDRLCGHVHEHMGIMLSEKKRTMLEGRMSRRLGSLDLPDMNAYGTAVLNRTLPEGELQHFYDLVTTNKTDFFRESDHFDFLRDRVLPEFLLEKRKPGRFKLWSAGSSSGMEAYTAGMFLCDFERKHPRFDFKILGTDICSKMLKTAERAVYSHREIEPVPEEMRHRYVLRGQGAHKGNFKIGPEITSRTLFTHLNFVEEPYPIRSRFHVIFHRNVLIYFDRPTQERVVNNLLRLLEPGGYLFLGHSESINNMDLPVETLAPTTFRKL